MPRKRHKVLLTIITFLSFIQTAFADITCLWLDTSGSMNKNGRIESAKEVLIGEIRKANPGDVLHIGYFDTNDYLIGRLAIDEYGSTEEKEKLIEQVKALSARGQWTNIDEPLQASKAILLEERAPGKRRIIILSDGLSDPSPDHLSVDLAKIAEIIPQDLGWSLYLIGLSEDIEGLFQTTTQESQLTVNPSYPHVKGIPLTEFNHDKIEEAFDVAKNDAPEPATTTSPQQTEPKPLPAPWPLLLGALVLAAISVPVLVLHKSKNRQKLAFVLEIRDSVRDSVGESKELQVSLEEGKKKTAGPKGEIQIESRSMELPPVIFSILWQKGTLWLLPQDSISVNGKLANDRVAISIGDLIKVRDKVSILIKEGGDNSVTE
ncbi:MAG: vWA domain-containing protein [Nitrospirota bacterium]